MEQLRQILSQMALNLELNIAMCDKIEDHEKRLKAVEISQAAQKTRVDALSTTVSEYHYAVSAAAYDARRKKNDS
mgnify:CR=1 FL=1